MSLLYSMLHCKWILRYLCRSASIQGLLWPQVWCCSCFFWAYQQELTVWKRCGITNNLNNCVLPVVGTRCPRYCLFGDTVIPTWMFGGNNLTISVLFMDDFKLILAGTHWDVSTCRLTSPVAWNPTVFLEWSIVLRSDVIPTLYWSTLCTLGLTHWLVAQEAARILHGQAPDICIERRGKVCIICLSCGLWHCDIPVVCPVHILGGIAARRCYYLRSSEMAHFIKPAMPACLNDVMSRCYTSVAHVTLLVGLTGPH